MCYVFLAFYVCVDLYQMELPGIYRTFSLYVLVHYSAPCYPFDWSVSTIPQYLLYARHNAPATLSGQQHNITFRDIT